MTTFRVTKAKKANGFTLGSLQRNLEGVSEVELESSPTLKRIYEIVEEGHYSSWVNTWVLNLRASHSNECFSRASL